METYTLMRQFADSWAMLALLIFFLGVIVWAFRPGSRKVHDDIANIPFRHDDKPAGGGAAQRPVATGSAKEA